LSGYWVVVYAARRASDGTTAQLSRGDAAVAYLVLAYWLVHTAGVDYIRARAAMDDEGRILLLARSWRRR
jgi:hypothetical protein